MRMILAPIAMLSFLTGLWGCGGEGDVLVAVPTYTQPMWVTYTTKSSATDVGRTVDALYNRPAGTDVRPAVVFSHGLYVETYGY